MRVEIGFGFALLLFASCGPAQDGSHPPVAALHDTNRIGHFWFSYPYQPQPGSRVWINVNPTNWVEVYPDGSQSRYRLLGQEIVDGLAGVVVTKTAGDAEITQTLNDGSFQAFIPDRNSAKIAVYFRNKIDARWQPWRPLAPINPIE